MEYAPLLTLHFMGICTPDWDCWNYQHHRISHHLGDVPLSMPVEGYLDGGQGIVDCVKWRSELSSIMFSLLCDYECDVFTAV